MRTLHQEIIREASSVGQPKHRLTTAQRKWLSAADERGRLPMMLAGRRVNDGVRRRCADAGWAAWAADHSYWITPAGRAVLAA